MRGKIFAKNVLIRVFLKRFFIFFIKDASRGIYR